MENIHFDFEGLVSIENIQDFETIHLLIITSVLVELSFDEQRIEGLEKALIWIDEIKKRNLSSNEKIDLYLIIANCWGYIYQLKNYKNGGFWNWESVEFENQLYYLRLALREQENIVYNADNLNGLSKIYTNLGNALDYVGRFVEAIEYWEKALGIIRNFPMAKGNIGVGLYHYAHLLYDEGQSYIFFKSAYEYLTSIVKDRNMYEDAEKAFDYYRKKIEQIISRDNLDEKIDLNDYIIGESHEEIVYRKWCLENRLFLNPLNDLGVKNIASYDVLCAPSIVMNLDSLTQSYDGLFNTLKQEFVTARWLAYEGIKNTEPHFSDKDVLLINTLDYPVYGLNIEKIKLAYRLAYSIFDKIAFFMNDYLQLKIKLEKVSFKSIWYEFGRNGDKNIREVFFEMRNLPFKGLFWLFKDLYVKGGNFKSSIEPDAMDLANIRNHLEHKYFKVHDTILADLSNQTDIKFDIKDKLAYSMTKENFEKNTMKILKLSRAAIIYLSLGIHQEEQRRSRERKGKVVTLYRDTFDDDWKV